MNIEDKIIKLGQLISSLNSQGKKEYGEKLLNDIIDFINIKERLYDSLLSKKAGINPVNYDTFIEKVVAVLQFAGFDLVEISLIDMEAINFLNRHRHLIKKPLTADYINSLILLYKWHCEMLERKPTNLTDLKNAYSEIENIRNEQGEQEL